MGHGNAGSEEFDQLDVDGKPGKANYGRRSPQTPLDLPARACRLDPAPPGDR